ncbi:Transcriptional regulator [Amycolatopsis camponoti]|uniref:Transcriptional regulator n=1 Tax=Amycolatopsis camponoti TaxID=2606593 RepID=A0A6I8LR68_9PSEU|nr:Transcriptional regulator [Amycolatopsis camponoti]
MREYDGVFEGLAATLAEERRHGVRGVAEEDDPAAEVSLEGRRQVVEVVVQQGFGRCPVDERRDRVVPVAEVLLQVRLEVGRAGAGPGDVGDEPVDVAAGQREHADLGAGGEGGAQPGARVVGDAAERHAAAVDGLGVMWEERLPDRAADAVRGDDEVGPDFAAAEADDAVFGHFGDFGAGAQALRGKCVAQAGDEVGPVDAGERPPVDFSETGRVPPGDPPSAAVTEPALVLGDEVFAEVDAEFVEAAQGIRPERDAGADVAELFGLFENGDAPPDPTQPDRGPQPGDATADHHCSHDSSSTGVEDSTPVECGFVERLPMIGDAAIEVIAAEGLRGLTHRAVDRRAGLPLGSTSYYARTRAALLSLTFARILELDQVAVSSGGLAESIAGYVAEALGPGRTRMLARYELALEATRRPELREQYDSGGAVIRGAAAELLSAAGSPDPPRHAGLVVDWMEGTIFGVLVGASGLPSREALVTGAREILTGIGIGSA